MSLFLSWIFAIAVMANRKAGREKGVAFFPV
jgi:hypothetical protein